MSLNTTSQRNSWPGRPLPTMESERKKEVGFFLQDENNIDEMTEPESANGSTSKRLSYTSKFYDVEGKGYLSKSQAMLRNLDLDGDGKLDAAELRPLLNRHKELVNDNRILRRNQYILGATTIFFGILTIVATVVAIRASKDTVVSSDGLLASKDTGKAVVTQSRGVSIVSEVQMHPGDTHEDAVPMECVHMEDVAALYTAFGEGTDMRILTNDTSVNGELDIAEPTSTKRFPVTKVGGSSAAINDTHVTIGDVAFHIAADNACNKGGRKYPHGPRKLFHDHLEGNYVHRRRRIAELSENLPLLMSADASDEQPSIVYDTIYDAVIVGAGWAGIAAAAKLVEEGAEHILILEGRDYVGGRSRTVTNFAKEAPDTPFEMGSEFIYTAWPNQILDIFKGQGLDYKTVDWAFSLFAPQMVGAPNGDGSPSSRVDDATYQEMSSDIWTNGFLKYLQKNLDWGSDSGYDSLLQDYEAQANFEDPVEEQFLEAESNMHIVIEFAEDGEKISAAGTSDWLHEVSSAGMALVSVPGGGYSNAIGSLVKKHNLNDKITFGANVKKVSYDDNHDDLVKIDYLQDETTDRSILAQTVLVTAPLGVLKSGAIEFEPELPEDKQEAINAMEVGVLDKFIMYWDEATMEKAPNFKEQWESISSSTWLELVTPATETSTFFTAFSNTRKYNGLYTMTAWIGGSAAQEMEQMENEDIESIVVANLKLMFATDVLPPTKYLVTRWGSDEFSMGSYSFRSVALDFDGTAGKLSESVDSKVFFAGEHTSVSGWGGTAVGAFETGEAAARAMAKSISGDVMVSLHHFNNNNNIQFS